MRRRRNTHMKLRELSSKLLLWCLIVMITALGDSNARVLPGQEVNKNRIQVTGIAAMHAQKESFERNEVTCMRKLTAHEETTSIDSKNERGRGRAESDNGEEGTSKMISGKEEYGLQKSSNPSDHKIDQINKQRNVEPTNASKFTNHVIRSSPTNTKHCSQDCNDDVEAYESSMMKSSSSSRHEQQISSEEPQGGTSTLQKDETDNLADEASKEIANLMYMDYKGKPSHKPPINNHEPGN